MVEKIDDCYYSDCYTAEELISILKQYPADTDIYIGLNGIRGGRLARCVCEEPDGTLTITNKRLDKKKGK